MEHDDVLEFLVERLLKDPHYHEWTLQTKKDFVNPKGRNGEFDILAYQYNLAEIIEVKSSFNEGSYSKAVSQLDKCYGYLKKYHSPKFDFVNKFMGFYSEGSDLVILKYIGGDFVCGDKTWKASKYPKIIKGYTKKKKK